MTFHLLWLLHVALDKRLGDIVALHPLVYVIPTSKTRQCQGVLCSMADLVCDDVHDRSVL